MNFRSLVRITIIAGILFILVSAAYTQEIRNDSLKFVDKDVKIIVSSDRSVKDSKSPRAAVLRSLFVPGWGQWYNEQKLKALLVFSAECSAVGAAIYWNQHVVSGPDYYRDDYINWRNEAVWWLVGFVLVSMADAYVDAHLFDFDESPDLSMNILKKQSFFGQPKVSNYLLRLSIKF